MAAPDDLFSSFVTSRGEATDASADLSPDASPPSLSAVRRRRRLSASRLLAGALATVSLLFVLAAGALYLELDSIADALRQGGKDDIVRSAERALGVEPALPLEEQLYRAVLREQGAARAAAVKPLLRGEARTILVVGSDRRWGERGRGRSDTILLVRLDPQAGTASLLSIPRDLRVPIAGYGMGKINAAYAFGGPERLIATLREYLGVRIDHYVEISFHGFGDLVGVLGGVLLPVDGRYFVPPGAGHMQIDLQPGYQRLARRDALSFVRFRHYDSDFYRAARQQLFLREVARQVSERRSDYRSLRRLIHAFADASASDISSLGELWELANAVRRLRPERLTRVVLPANSLLLGGTYYLESSDEDRRRAMLRWAYPQALIRLHRRDADSLRRQAARARATRSGGSAGAALVPDGGRMASLVAASGYRARRCAPSALPSGYRWGSHSPVRSYRLEGHPALARWASAGSGRSLLLMQTTWQEAPVLTAPSSSLRYRGRRYQLWYESGALRQLAWRMGETVAWLTNTLRNELSAATLLELAASCTPVPAGREP
jgi:LCP family protein required for cell wall assembly